MEKKEKLRIALRLTELNDYVPEFDNFNEDIEEFEAGTTIEQIKEVCEEFEGWGSDKITDEIINEYFN